MDPNVPVTRASGDRVIRIAWAAMPMVVPGYVLFRYGLSGATPMAVAQVLYLAPLAVGAAALARVACCTVRNTRSRRVWALLAASVASVMAGEVVLSLKAVFGVDNAATTLLFDTANAVAAVLFGWMLVYAARVDQMGWRRALHVLLDGIALFALGFAVLYGYYTGGRAWSPADTIAAARFSTYGALAVAVFVGNIAAFGTPSAMRFRWNRPLASGILLFAVAVGIWAFVALVRWPGEMPAVLDAATGVIYLIAYFLIMMAAVYRLRSTEPASVLARRLTLPAVWPSSIVSTLVLLSVAWTGYLAVTAAQGSTSALIYLGTLSVATVAMVVRTALVSADTDELAQRAVLDAATGAFARSMRERCFAEIRSQADQSGCIPAAFSIDLDDFAHVNVAQGFRGGDRYLASVVEVLRRVSGRDARVLRQRSDEFVVFAVVRNRVAAMTLGREMLAAMRRVDLARRPLSASIGVAVLGEDAHDAESLVRCATLAQVWVKRHGKNRVSSYDSRVAFALALDERLSKTDERVRLDMVRALLAAADARDPANRYHARNVAALARLLAQDLELDGEHVGRIEIAAILHDVGKIALPNTMLGGKTLPFAARESEREHSALGEQLAESLGVDGVPRWVRAHHERWDGGGYPDELKGEAIPLESRIIALCDSYDGMTAGKRYGAPMSKAAALQEIDLGIGTRFDPDLAERFIRLVGTTGALGWSDDWAGQ